MMISNHVVQRLLLRSAGAVAASSTFSSYCGVSRSSRASIIVDFNGTIGSLSMMCIRSMASSSSFSPTTSDRQKRYDIKIVEVGPRDGLQNEKQFVSTQGKTELIENLANKANVGVIEAGAFVSPKWVPQMADSKEVFEHLNFGLDTTQKPYLSCLVPNIQGLEQVLQINNNKNSKSGHRIIDEIAIFGSASEEFSQRNIACSIDESFERFQTVADYLKDHQESSSANKLKIRGYVSTVVGCPYQGHVSPTKVASCVEKMLDLGCYEVSLGDTIGIGTPGSIQTMLEEVLMVVDDPTQQLAMHFHDTYGQALTNIYVGLERGIKTIDSSVAGLGGCPYAKGASGNVATEDVVYMLHGMGLDTGIDLDELVLVGERICQLLGRQSQSKVARAMLQQREQ